MNRRERRALERQGKLPKAEPVYSMKPSDMRKSMLSGIAKTALREEINKQCIEASKGLTLDMDAMYLWALHVRHGWGAKRLYQFYKDVFEEHKAMREFYEMEDTYPERQKLKAIGVDLEAWYDELFNPDGTYKEEET